jgi:transcription termination factor NusB
VEWVVPIIVAIIGGPLVVVIQLLRKENTEQHAEARALLNQVADKVDKVDTKLDGHINWHLERK